MSFFSWLKGLFVDDKKFSNPSVDDIDKLVKESEETYMNTLRDGRRLMKAKQLEIASGKIRNNIKELYDTDSDEEDESDEDESIENQIGRAISKPIIESFTKGLGSKKQTEDNSFFDAEPPAAPAAQSPIREQAQEFINSLTDDELKTYKKYFQK